MVALRRKLLYLINSLIVLLISLLGFTTSCEVAEEYGTPHADFMITGRVISATDNLPIPDIIIEMRQLPKPENSSQGYLIATSFSYTNGIYYVSASESPTDHSFQIKFIDTDGALNGEYQTLDTTVVFQDPLFTTSDDEWYKGYTQKTLDVTLKPKDK